MTGSAEIWPRWYATWPPRLPDTRCIAVTNTTPAEELQEADMICDSLEQIDLATLCKLVD